MPVLHLPTPQWDDQWQGEIVATDDTHRYVWLWYGFNIRLLAVPHGDRYLGSDYGWCYRRDPDAVRAHVRAWNPDTEDEPPGWHKRPGAEVRRAPHRDPHDPRNGVRCEHGAYLGSTCHTGICHDMLHLQRHHGVHPAQDFRSTP